MAAQAPLPQPMGPAGRPAGRGRGVLVGATGSFIPSQMAADIYLVNRWTTVGQLLRASTFAVGWGMSIILIQEAHAQQAPELEANLNWTFQPLPGNAAAWPIVVDDMGQDLQNEPVPGVLPNIAAPGLGHYNVNGVLRYGVRLPWHHRVRMRSRHLPLPGRAFGRMHYHKHEPRQQGELDPPAIYPFGHPEASHYHFDELLYSTQVQNCRRARDT